MATIKSDLDNKKKENPPNPDEISRLETKYDQAEKEENQAKVTLQEKKATWENAEETRKSIELLRDSAILQASSTASAHADTGIVVKQEKIDSQTATAIATSVQTIVTNMLNKRYERDNCFLFLTQGEAAVQRSLSVIYDYEAKKLAEEQKLSWNANTAQRLRAQVAGNPQFLERNSSDPLYVMEAKSAVKARRDIVAICEKILIGVLSKDVQQEASGAP